MNCSTMYADRTPSDLIQRLPLLTRETPHHQKWETDVVASFIPKNAAPLFPNSVCTNLVIENDFRIFQSNKNFVKNN